MGSNPYNISDVSGNGTGGPGDWSYSALTSQGMLVISGDFDRQELNFLGAPTGSSDDTHTTYVFSDTGGDTGSADPGDPDSFEIVTHFGTLVYNTQDGQFEFTINITNVKDEWHTSGTAPITVNFTVVGTTADLDPPAGIGSGVDDDSLSFIIAVCVARGTSIAVPGGQKPVEQLQSGDLVLTHDGQAKPVRWVGSRKLSKPELEDAPHLQPIRIDKGAFGAGLPNRTLTVSPQHRVLVSGWKAQLYFGQDENLAPAKSLINGLNVRRYLPEDGVEYFHVLFNRHEVMQTNGLWTESFFPGDRSIAGLENDTRRELLCLFPELDQSEAKFGPSYRPCLRGFEGALIGLALAS